MNPWKARFVALKDKPLVTALFKKFVKESTTKSLLSKERKNQKLLVKESTSKNEGENGLCPFFFFGEKT